MWVRGLKHERFIIKTHLFKSHPMWVRGLKLNLSINKLILRSRTLCGCVD